MWPKMLLELLPHFARLVPAADKYLNSRSAGEKAQDAALTALAENVRGNLGQVTDEQAGLRRQLQEQNAQLAQVGVEVTRARMGVESIEARIASLEKSGARARGLLVVSLVFHGATLLLISVLLVKLKGH